MKMIRCDVPMHIPVYAYECICMNTYMHMQKHTHIYAYAYTLSHPSFEEKVNAYLFNAKIVKLHLLKSPLIENEISMCHNR